MKQPKDGSLTPNGMVRDPMYSTGAAFDNYDLYVETFYDTVGIANQTIPEEDEPIQCVSVAIGEGFDCTSSPPERKKRRRTFNANE